MRRGGLDLHRLRTLAAAGSPEAAIGIPAICSGISLCAVFRILFRVLAICLFLRNFINPHILAGCTAGGLQGEGEVVLLAPPGHILKSHLQTQGLVLL